MTLALGDALAVALMEHRRFTPEHFREFHPGGKLGARLSKVRDLMHTGDALPLVDGATGMGDDADRDQPQGIRRRRSDAARTAPWRGSSPTATCGASWTGCSRIPPPR